jgi:hypothetical protein
MWITLLASDPFRTTRAGLGCASRDSIASSIPEVGDIQNPSFACGVGYRNGLREMTSIVSRSGRTEVALMIQKSLTEDGGER